MGAWIKDKEETPKIVSAEKRKKAKGFTSTSVSTSKDDDDDEEEEDEETPPIPEGFHLLSDDIDCKNIRKADGFQHYVRAICHQFEPIVRKAGNVPNNY